MTRTQDEIVARTRIESYDEASDMFGFARDVLVEALDFTHARPYLKPEVTEAEWNTERAGGADVSEAARRYLEFAIGKIRNHRGISAGRNVDKLTEFAWLLGRDDVIAAMEAADYPQYGAPKVKAFADGMGWPWPEDDDLARMADGLPCESSCESGCGQ